MMFGIDLGGTKTEVIALDENGVEHFRQRQPTPRDDYRATLQGIASLLAEAERHTGVQGSIGIGIPGTISTLTGKVKNANSTWLNGQPLHRDLEQLVGRSVSLANDANCLAISEATDGAGAGSKVVFAVIIGTGCGGGVALRGGVFGGGNGVAGEWGHNPLPWQDAEERAFARDVPCYCGKRGCNELFISGTGFETTWQRLGQPKLKGSEIMARLAQGDKLAEQALSLYEQRLAKALANVVNLLDPDVIVLGGGMSNTDRLYQTLPNLMKEWVFGGECATPVRKAQHGDSSGVRGAAWLPKLAL
ncbi:fructokinase [Izhakiella australiensis]|uniref:Fructokinase n=1 Tax=Izhakiella australiensis TaxID=1926881 RepID=A0A1S8YRP7_9GAMM|nr:fructokinase [Izhakiella australiensis]OON41720.1 fructokinase [Izhakiella australiensis]